MRVSSGGRGAGPSFFAYRRPPDESLIVGGHGVARPEFEACSSRERIDRLEIADAANTWSHVAATYDRATSKLRLYVNGNLDREGSARYPGTAIYSSQTDILIGAVNGQIYPSASEHFSGSIDELELFNRALSASEIQAVYTAGSAGKCKNQPPIANAGPDRTIECGGPRLHDHP